ncbi:MAG: zinc-ribbon domain-containing protein [candidate division KSB1 bacterium]|nr:zinc-ribbon domain-containing protein [candidate division KSB1 bacterium]
MYIVCPACNKRLQIPDNKLPTDHAVRITCPACQERFSYDPRVPRAPGGALAEPGLGALLGTAAAAPRPPEANAMQALICLDHPAHQEACQQSLQALGYTADVMPNQFKALEYLRQVPYRLFVLDAAFDGTSLDTNLVLTFLRERPLEQRRYQFVVLCAPDLVTADAMTAYSQSVNLVLNHADMPNCGPLLGQYLAEHELLYRTFREMRQQLGKEV